MANFFFDTSAFVKRYHPEPGTDCVLALFNLSTNPKIAFRSPRLTLVEVRSAFAVKVRTKAIDQRTAAALWVQLLSDVAARVFEVLPITDTHYQLAEQLFGQYAFQSRLRTLDAVQLAVAVE